MLKALARWLGYVPQSEARTGSLENPAVSLSDYQAWADLGWVTTSDAGEAVNKETMLSVPAVWQAVGMISGDCSRLPLDVYALDGEDREVDYRHTAARLITLTSWANPEVSALCFWRRLLVHALIWPRGYGWIERDPAGVPIGLYNLLPDRTELLRTSVDKRLWVVSEIQGRPVAFDPWDVLIVENLSLDECLAFGPLKAARHNVGLQLAKRNFTSRFFSNGLHAGGILQVPPGASDKARDKVEKAILERFNKSNAFKTLVLRDGFKWHSTTIEPDKAQMDRVEEQEVRNIARFYRMSPSRLGVKESVSYNSDEAARRAYYDETLSYWLTAIKSECNLKLLSTAERENRTRTIDYRVEAWLWANTEQLMRMGTLGIQWGVFNRDEVRRWFNYNPIPDGVGKQFLQPLNMAEAGKEPEPAPEDSPPANDQSQDEDQDQEQDEDVAAATNP
jgi:HK97 family phage portal protein